MLWTRKPHPWFHRMTPAMTVRYITFYVDELSPSLTGPEQSPDPSRAHQTLPSENLRFRYRDWRSPEPGMTVSTHSNSPGAGVSFLVSAVHRLESIWWLITFSINPPFGLKFAINFFLWLPKLKQKETPLSGKNCARSEGNEDRHNPVPIFAHFTNINQC